MIATALADEFLGNLFAALLAFVKAHPYLLALVLLVLLAKGFLRRPVVKGWIGEKATALKVLRKLPEDRYRVFQDVYLPRPDGKGTTQIDHVVVSLFGVFVIETKNMSGWIFGDTNSRQWTQVIFRKKSRFQNPLHQNALHINALAKALGLSKDGFYNLVFFVGDVEFKKGIPENVITRTKDLHAAILIRRERILSTGEFARLCTELEQGLKCRQRRDVKRAHRAQFAQRR